MPETTQNLANSGTILPVKGPKKSLIDSFNRTNLDTENSEPSGGPNRTNSSNIPTGQYKAVGSSPFPLSPTPGGAPLKTREGQDKEFTVNAYTPQNTYMQAMVKFRDEAKNELI